jgi:hypothetical protein
MAKVKRTYNLHPEVVAAVRLLAEKRIAPSQDGVIERAVRDLARRTRDSEHSQRWAEAADDPEFQAEVEEVGAAFAADDLTAWTAG